MDIYDVLVALLEHAARSGLAEHLVVAARDAIEKADPKVAEKRRAAEAAQVEADAQYKRFLAYQQLEQRQAAEAASAAPPAPPAPGSSSSGGPFSAPVVNS